MNQRLTAFSHPGLAIICLLFLVTGALRLNDLSLYTPDSTRYLLWGNSLAQGHGFVDETLPDPDRYVVHAPLYPILIAPVEYLWPLSVVAVKVWTLLWGVAAIILVYLWLERVLGRSGAIIGALVLAANPLFWLYSTEVLSDAPFIASLAGAMVLAERLETEPARASRWFPLLLVLVAFAAMVREVGATMVLACVLYCLSRKRFTQAAVLAVTSGALMALWYARNSALASSGYAVGNVSLVFQKLVTGDEVPIVNEFLLRMWLSFQSYASQLAGVMLSPMYTGQFGHLFFSPSPASTAIERVALVAQLPASIALGLLIIAGLFSDLRTGPSSRLRAIFFALYLAVILLYPINDTRFLVPLVPFFILYLLRGVAMVFGRIRLVQALAGERAALALALLLLVPNVTSMAEIVMANRRYLSSPPASATAEDENALFTSLYSRPWSLLGGWFTEHVDTGAIIISPYKQLAAVVGNRKVLTLDKGITLPRFERQIREFGIAYVVAPCRWGTIAVYEEVMSASKRFRFDSAFAVGDLRVYHVRSKLREQSPQPEAVADSVHGASALMRKGWAALARGAFRPAEEQFQRALALAPAQPEVVYYLLMTSTFLDDSAKAQAYYEQLYAMPQAGSYLDPSKGYLKAMNQLLEARRLKYDEGVAVQSYKAAYAFWKLGAGWKAREILNLSLRADSAYFVGLLWGMHFNLQLGDTAQARSWLATLERIDSKNQVVETFRHVINLGDSIRMARSLPERGAYRLTVAELYRKIELFDEALDEAERSLADDSTSASGRMLLADLLRPQCRPRVAAEAYRQVLSVDPANALARSRADSLLRMGLR